MCYTVNHEGAAIGLSLNNFKNIVDECEQNGLMTLFIANGSEPLIYSEVKEAISYATAKIPDVGVFTNAVKLDRDMASFLVSSGLSRVNISLDAATSTTYKIFVEEI